MEAIENALVCGACLLYQGRGEKAEVQRYVAIHILADARLQGFPGVWAVKAARAQSFVSTAVQALFNRDGQYSAYSVSFDLVTSSDYITLEDDKVELKADNLLNAAYYAYEQGGVALEEEVRQMISPGSLCATPLTEALLGQVLSQTFRSSLTDIFHHGYEALHALYEAAAAPPPALEGASAADAAEHHWPTLGQPAPAPKNPFTAATNDTKRQQPRSPRASNNGSVGSAAADTNGRPGSPAADNGTNGQLAPAVGYFRNRVNVQYGDPSVLWGPLIDTVRGTEAWTHLPTTDFEELTELLSLALAVVVVIPATNVLQTLRQVTTLGVMTCPTEIARRNKGRHRCMTNFVQRIAILANKHMNECTVPKKALPDSDSVVASDPFYFIQGEQMVLKLRQIAAIAVRFADAPPNKYPHNPFPPSLSLLEVTLHHNQAKPVVEVLIRLLQPPTVKPFCIAALDVMRRVSHHEATDTLPMLLQSAIESASKPQTGGVTWPTKMVQASVRVKHAEARAAQQLAAPTATIDALLDKYRASKQPSPPPRGRGGAVFGGTSGDADDGSHGGGRGGRGGHNRADPSPRPPVPPPGGVIGADFIASPDRAVVKANKGRKNVMAQAAAVVAAPPPPPAPAVTQATGIAEAPPRRELLELAGIASDDESATDNTQPYQQYAAAPPARGPPSPVAQAPPAPAPAAPAYTQPQSMFAPPGFGAVAPAAAGYSNGTYNGASGYTPVAPQPAPVAYQATPNPIAPPAAPTYTPAAPSYVPQSVQYTSASPVPPATTQQQYGLGAVKYPPAAPAPYTPVANNNNNNYVSYAPAAPAPGGGGFYGGGNAGGVGSYNNAYSQHMAAPAQPLYQPVQPPAAFMAPRAAAPAGAPAGVSYVPAGAGGVAQSQFGMASQAAQSTSAEDDEVAALLDMLCT